MGGAARLRRRQVVELRPYTRRKGPRTPSAAEGGLAARETDEPCRARAGVVRSDGLESYGARVQPGQSS